MITIRLPDQSVTEPLKKANHSNKRTSISSFGEVAERS